MVCDFKTYYKVTVIKMVYCERIDKDQWNRIENPEIDNYRYGQLILTNKWSQYNWAKIGSSTNGSGTTGHPNAKQKKKERKWT